MTGKTFGRWTVLDDFITTPKGEVKWLCRCRCGTERYVLERSLKYGGSLSCGCLQKEALSEAVSHDLAGQRFGQLTVLGRAAHQRKNGGVRWRCLCDCGNECEIPGTLLVTGRKTHCGGDAHEKKHFRVDIGGRRFGRLVASYPTRQRSDKGDVIWHCVCDCGNEVDVAYNSLVYANQRSCGCKKREHEQQLGQFQTRVDGTSLDIIRSSKLPSDNTSGIKGVYRIKGKYVAKIVFRKQQYYLGAYDRIEDAAAARKEAEEAIFGTAIGFYEKWNRRAQADPGWANENPVQLTVKKDSNDRFYLEMLPNME